MKETREEKFNASRDSQRDLTQEPVQDKTDLLRMRWIWPDFPILFV
jgi:hypothetical protein